MLSVNICQAPKSLSVNIKKPVKFKYSSIHALNAVEVSSELHENSLLYPNKDCQEKKIIITCFVFRSFKWKFCRFEWPSPLFRTAAQGRAGWKTQVWGER